MSQQMSYYGTFGATAQITYLCWVEGEKIVYSDMQGQRQTLGATNAAYEEMQRRCDSLTATCKEYQDKLIELGVIKPKLTGEDLINAQAEELERMKQVLGESERMLAQFRDFFNTMHAQETATYEPDEISAADQSVLSGIEPGMEEGNSGGGAGNQRVQKHAGRPAPGNRRTRA